MRFVVREVRQGRRKLPAKWTSMLKRDCSSEPSVGASRLVGDPVDIITGAVIDQDPEFRVPGGQLPLQWVRYYDSRHAAADRGIGRGFRHELDHELRLDVDGLTYSDPRWRETAFPFLENGHVFHDDKTYENPHYHGPAGEHLCYDK